MPSVTNERLLFKDYVSGGFPEPGTHLVFDDSEKIELDTVALDGGLLLQTLTLSVDPYMRGKMNKPSGHQYSGAYELGKPLSNHGVALILRSEDPAFKKGDRVYGFLDFAKYQVKTGAQNWVKLDKKANLPWTVYTGAAGMPGKTAWFAWKEYAFPQKGDIAFITAGAGPVGSMVIQLAKLDGVKVIASAGSDEKVAFLKTIGADVAFNYKTQKTSDVLKKEGPINIFWDNVGGETLDDALAASASGARFIECGMISQYNVKEPYGIKNLSLIIGRQIKMSGFLVPSLAHKYEENFYREVPQLLADGKIKYVEDVTKGLKGAGHAIVDQQRGTNTGKSVIVVSED